MKRGFSFARRSGTLHQPSQFNSLPFSIYPAASTKTLAIDFISEDEVNIFAFLPSFRRNFKNCSKDNHFIVANKVTLRELGLPRRRKPFETSDLRKINRSNHYGG